MSNGQKNLTIAGLSILFVILSGLFLWNRYNITQSSKELNASVAKLNKAKKQYRIHKETVSKEVYEFAAHNGNSETKIVGRQYVAIKNLDTMSKKLFSIVFNYSNSSSYQDRRSKANNLVDKNILANSDLFGNDTEESYKVVDTLDISSSFNNVSVYITGQEENSITGFGIVNYTLQSGSTINRGTRVYRLTYDRKSGMFTQVEKFN